MIWCERHNDTVFNDTIGNDESGIQNGIYSLISILKNKDCMKSKNQMQKLREAIQIIIPVLFHVGGMKRALCSPIFSEFSKINRSYCLLRKTCIVSEKSVQFFSWNIEMNRLYVFPWAYEMWLTVPVTDRVLALAGCVPVRSPSVYTSPLRILKLQRFYWQMLFNHRGLGEKLKQLWAVALEILTHVQFLHVSCIELWKFWFCYHRKIIGWIKSHLCFIVLEANMNLKIQKYLV